jgi:thiamin-phosphate kinase
MNSNSLTLIGALGDQARGPASFSVPATTRPSSKFRQCSCQLHRHALPGEHTFPLLPADLIGQRAMGVTSPISAMGADADYVLIAVTMPDGSADWITHFAHGVAAAARRFGVKVAGGNLARGPLNVTVGVHGHVVPADALRRSGAKPGDLVCVSGSLGGAALALARSDLLQPGDATTLLSCAPNSECYPLRRYYLPEPQLALGWALRGLATAAIDISDGLVADLGHICRASGVAATLDLDAVPAVAGWHRSVRPFRDDSSCASRSRKNGTTRSSIYNLGC